MLTRLTTAKTPKAIRGFIYFTSLFIDKEGVLKVQQSLDAVGSNFFTVLLEQIWLPNLQSMHFRHTDQKVVAVAMTKVSFFLQSSCARHQVASIMTQLRHCSTHA